MGEPEKEDALDEALQIRSPNEILPEPIVEGSETFQKEMREMLKGIYRFITNGGVQDTGTGITVGIKCG